MEKEEIIKRIAENIRLQRYRKNITQEELAEKAEISTKYMNLIENRKANPSITVLVRLCEILDLEFSKLLKSND